MRLAGLVLTAALIVLAVALAIVAGPALTGRHPVPAVPHVSVPAAPRPSSVLFTGPLPSYQPG
jgi:hypothetical protein